MWDMQLVSAIVLFKLVCLFNSLISLTPMKVISDFSVNLKYIDMFYGVDADICIRGGDKPYRKFKKNSKSEIAKGCYIVELRTDNKNENSGGDIPNSNNKPESWRFLACFTKNKQYRNYVSIITYLITNYHFFI